MAHQIVDIPVLVKARRPQTPGHVSLVLERPPRFDYQAGDWIDLAFAGELSGGKTYSLSSAPSEADLAITFKEGQSGIKQTLQDADRGDRYRITAYGNDYNFSLRQHRSSVLIAAGVGVAPFRSMICEMAHHSSADSVHLVYLNRRSRLPRAVPALPAACWAVSPGSIPPPMVNQ